ncbi:DUF1697 domain-containing protein [Mycolicibacterium sp. 3033]|nr:DUF1697 domain-containing protein [Mycolicibacterium aurantiacum]
MTRYVALLRGVNVGGVKLRMPDVARTLEQAGFTDVTTVLATGNVLLSSRAGAASVRTEAEKALRDEFGYDAWVLVYDLEALAEISAAYPFEREREGHQSYVTFVSDRKAFDELAGLSAGPKENIETGDGVIYWQVAKGSTLDSTIGKTMGDKRFKPSTTTRNLRTIDKLLAG